MNADHALKECHKFLNDIRGKRVLNTWAFDISAYFVIQLVTIFMSFPGTILHGVLINNFGLMLTLPVALIAINNTIRIGLAMALRRGYDAGSVGNLFI